MEGEIFIFLSKQQLDLERETSSVLSTKSFIVNVNFGQCLISISFPVFVVGGRTRLKKNGKTVVATVNNC